LSGLAVAEPAANATAAATTMRQLQIVVRGTDRVRQAIVIGRGPPSPISNRAPAKAQSRRQSKRFDQQVEPPSATPKIEP
jgi:hypothetical protein